MRSGIFRAALTVSAGSALSRILGLVREQLMAGLFGRSAATDAFAAASRVPVTVYDLLVGGMISAALVPVLSTESENDQAEFWRLVGLLASLFAAVLAAGTVLLALTPSAIGALLWPRFDEPTGELAHLLLRIMAPSLFFLGLSGLATGVLQARRQFLAPAFGAAVFNIALIAVAWLLRGQGVVALAAGVLTGAVAQLGLQLLALRGMPIRFGWDLGNPALRRIGLLYLPVLLGLVVSSLGVVIDTNLASGLLPGDLTAMRFATTLTQFALGLIATAIGSAFLPELARRATGAPAEFAAALGAALRAVVFLIVPVTLALALFRDPVVRLLFERGAFGSQDTARTALAFLFYAPSIPAAAIDQILIYAFYARQDTIRPVVVGVIAVGVYVLVALLLVTPLGMVGLVLGNTAQWTIHAIIMGVLAIRLIGGSRDSAETATNSGTKPAKFERAAGIGALALPVGRIGIAGLAAALVWASLAPVVERLTEPVPLIGGLGFAGLAGITIYLLVLTMLRAPEVAMVRRMIRR